MKSDKRTSSRAEKKVQPRPHKKSAVAVGYSKKSALLEEAITQMNAGKYGRTSAALKELLALDPHNTEARRLYATLHLRLGNLMTARAAFDSLAQEAIQRQDYWLAESLLHEYLAAGPRCVPFLELLGHVYEEKGDKAAAVVEYGKAIEILLEDPDTDRPNRAQELYDLIHTLAPTSPVTAKMGPLIAEHAARLQQATEAKPLAVPEEASAAPIMNTAISAPAPVMPWETGMEDASLSADASFQGIDPNSASSALPPPEITPVVHEGERAQCPQGSDVLLAAPSDHGQPMQSSPVPDLGMSPTVLADSAQVSESQPVPISPTVEVAGEDGHALVAAPIADAPDHVVPSNGPDQQTESKLNTDSPSAPQLPSDQQTDSPFAFLRDAFRLVTGTQEAEGTRQGPTSESTTSLANPPSEAAGCSLLDRLSESKSTAKSWEAVLGKTEVPLAPQETKFPSTVESGLVDQTVSSDPTSQRESVVTEPQFLKVELPPLSDHSVAAVAETAVGREDLVSPSPGPISAPMPWEQVVDTSVPIPPPPEPEPITVDATEHSDTAQEYSAPSQTVKELTTTGGVDQAAAEVPGDAGITPPKDTEMGLPTSPATVSATDGIRGDDQAWRSVESPNIEVNQTASTDLVEAPTAAEGPLSTDAEAGLQDVPVSAPETEDVPPPITSFAPETSAAHHEQAVYESTTEQDLSRASSVSESELTATHSQRNSAEPAGQLSSEQVVESVHDAQGDEQPLLQEVTSTEEATSWTSLDQEKADARSREQPDILAWSGLEEEKLAEPEPAPVADRLSLWARWIRKSPTEYQPSEDTVAGEQQEEPLVRTWEHEEPAYSHQGNAASAVEVLFDAHPSSKSFEGTARRRRSKVTLKISAGLARLRFAILVFLQTGFFTTRAIAVSLILLVGVTAVIALLTAGIVAVGWIIQEEKPSKSYQNLGTLPQRVLADPTRNGYLVLMAFDAPASENVFQVWLELHSRANHAELATACLGGSGGGDAQNSATVMAIQGMFQSADPVRDIQSQAGNVRSWLKQYGTELTRYKQWLKLPFEDWGYGQPMSPNCPLVLATHRLYIAEGLEQNLEEGLSRLEADMAAWRAALARARTLPVKMLALDGLSDDVGIVSSLLMQHELDAKHLPRLTKLVRPLDQSEQSLRWPMQSEFVAAARSVHAAIRSDTQGERPWYVAVVSAMPLPKQRRLNAYADYYEAAAKIASELPRQSLPKLSSYVRTPAERWTDYLANPIELLLGVKPLPAWDPYSNRIFEMEARLRLVSLQAWIRKDTESSDLAARVAQAGQSFYDPFTGLPMLINQRERVLYSVGANRKDDGADPARDVIVAIPPDSTLRSKPVNQVRAL